METTWNYRVMKRIHENGQVTYGLYEVYWKGGEVDGYTQDPVSGYYCSLNELCNALDAMAKGVSSGEILEYKNSPSN